MVNHNRPAGAMPMVTGANKTARTKARPGNFALTRSASASDATKPTAEATSV